MQELVAQIIGVTKVYQKNKAAPAVHALAGVLSVSGAEVGIETVLPRLRLTRQRWE